MESSLKGNINRCRNSKKRLLNEIELILSKITYINASVVFYKQLIKSKINDPDKYSAGENFFNSVLISYESVITCELWKIYNPKEEKGSLYSILNLCENNKNLFESEYESNSYIYGLRVKIEEKDIKTLRTYRNKYFAHSDKKFFGKENKLLEEYSFNLDYFEDLNKYAINVLSEIYEKIDNCSYCFNPNLLTGYDLYNIIRNL